MSRHPPNTAWPHRLKPEAAASPAAAADASLRGSGGVPRGSLILQWDIKASRKTIGGGDGGGINAACVDADGYAGPASAFQEPGAVPDWNARIWEMAHSNLTMCPGNMPIRSMRPRSMPKTLTMESKPFARKASAYMVKCSCSNNCDTSSSNSHDAAALLATASAATLAAASAALILGGILLNACKCVHAVDPCVGTGVAKADIFPSGVDGAKTDKLPSGLDAP